MKKNILGILKSALLDNALKVAIIIFVVGICPAFANAAFQCKDLFQSPHQSKVGENRHSSDSRFILDQKQYDYVVNGEVLYPNEMPGVIYYPQNFDVKTNKVSGFMTVDLNEFPSHRFHGTISTQTQKAEVVAIRRELLHVEGSSEPMVAFPNIFRIGIGKSTKSWNVQNNKYIVAIPMAAIKDGILQEGTFAGPARPHEQNIYTGSYTYRNGVLTVKKKETIGYRMGSPYRTDDITLRVWISPDLLTIGRIEVEVSRTQDIVPHIPYKRTSLVTNLHADGPFEMSDFTKPGFVGSGGTNPYDDFVVASNPPKPRQGFGSDPIELAMAKPLNHFFVVHKK